MRRRRFLAAAAGGLGAATAGCSQQTVSTDNPALLEDRPPEVYVPTHTDGMGHVATREAGRLRLALTFARPHRFWLVTGTRSRKVDVGEADAVHLMVTVWDAETGTVLPTANAAVAISQDGESVLEKSLWPMLSQTMGVHFGDNVALPGDGTYEVTVRYGPIDAALGGGLADLDPARRDVTFTYEYEQSAVADLGFEDLGYRAGRKDAVEPMNMGMVPVGQVPPVEDLPGRAVGQGLTGSAVAAGTVLEQPPAGIDGSGPYLAVSLRTPYNRYPLPFASLSADGAALARAIHPALGFHYGRVLDGDLATPLEVTVDAPPQLARHEGYETAFMELPAVTLSA